MIREEQKRINFLKKSGKKKGKPDPLRSWQRQWWKKVDNLHNQTNRTTKYDIVTKNSTENTRRNGSSDCKWVKRYGKL